MNYGIRPSGYRLPEETHIGAVHLQVSDLERSVAFYQGVLGFDVIEKDAQLVSLGAGDATLIELRAGATIPSPAKRIGLYHFAILLPDRPALGRCIEHLANFGIRLGAADHLVSEAIYLSDPDGLGIEIYRDRPRGEWSTTGRELAMASEALDFQSVLESGGGAAWEGMPAATVIGHVHLHVGDIDQGKAFYHNAVGLDIVVWSYPGALFLSAGGYHHHLGTNVWAGPRAEAPAREEPQLLAWDLVLPGAVDVAEAVASISAAGFSVSPEEVGGSVALDPWGTPLRLISGT